MLTREEAELKLDLALRLIGEKTKYAAVYQTLDGRQLALERRASTPRIFIEPDGDVSSLRFSSATTVEAFASDRPRVHLPAPRLVGPYRGRPGFPAICVRPATAADLDLLLDAYLRRKVVAVTDEGTTTSTETDEECGYPEGAEAYKQHRSRERNRTLAARAKATRLAERGALDCDACGFDFLAVYGELGRGFIEAHHIEPLSERPVPRATRIEELALVCANCHRMLHRAGLLDPRKLKALILRSET